MSPCRSARWPRLVASKIASAVVMNRSTSGSSFSAITDVVDLTPLISARHQAHLCRRLSTEIARCHVAKVPPWIDPAGVELVLEHHVRQCFCQPPSELRPAAMLSDDALYVRSAVSRLGTGGILDIEQEGSLAWHEPLAERPERCAIATPRLTHRAAVGPMPLRVKRRAHALAR